MPVNDNLVIENAHLILRNFSGRAKQYNDLGNRNFGVLLDHNDAQRLVDAGWRVRWLAPKDGSDQPVPFLPVSIRFDNFPPKVIQITSHGKVVLTEKTIGSLDTAEIEKVDLIIRPYNWNARGNSGVKAYVKSMYVTIVEDVFEAKYFAVPDGNDDPPF